MKLLFILEFIFINSLPGIALSQPFQIPVVPFDDKPPHISYKIHKRCKRNKNYWKCIDRSDQKVMSSLEMDY